MTPEEQNLDMLVAELDRENRLLRARNERLEAEIESMTNEIKHLRSLVDSHTIRSDHSGLLLRGTQVNMVWWDGKKLMNKPVPLENLYKEPDPK
jgi:predicted RNase H-like nuclease (RuvC/YqgF family)